MLAQFLFPTDRAPRAWDNVLITVNALFIGAGITANVAFEKVAGRGALSTVPRPGRG
ncbi:hypothetical protein [Streptomyces olivaceoviridis]|uniref:hypothetical protein n=1 Tax=Streptomyces olivaceoviridis TaxID=1921 RepID=UPI0036ACBE8E